MTLDVAQSPWRGGRITLAALALVLAAGCTPRLQPNGPEVGAPALAGDRLVMADGTALPLRVWRPTDRPEEAEPEAVILAVHGFNDYSHAFELPARYWADRGIMTYAYDQRGFGDTPHRGLWPGEERLVQDLREAASLVAARHPAVPFFLLGESMGGAVVLAAAVSEAPPEADGLILVAPAVWGREAQGPFQSLVLWLAAHSMPWLTLTGEGLDILPTDNIELLRQMARDPLVIKETRVDAIYGLVGIMDRAWDAAPELDGTPALLLYGAREEVIPEDAALAWLRRLPDGSDDRRRVAIYPGGYHMLLRDLKAEVVLEDVAHWIVRGTDEAGAPLPSGADHLAQALIGGEAEDFASARAAALPLPPAAGEIPTPEGAAAAVLDGKTPEPGN